MIMSEYDLEGLKERAEEICEWGSNNCVTLPQREYMFLVNDLPRAVNELRAAEKRIEKLVEVVDSRPRHCEYLDEDGGFGSKYDQYVEDVEAWVHVATEATKNG